MSLTANAVAEAKWVSDMRTTLTVGLLFSLLLVMKARAAEVAGDPDTDKGSATQQPAKPKADWYAGEQSDSGWYVEFYPIYGYAPVFGANITLPQLPSLPGGAGLANKGSTGPSLNYALESAIRVEKRKFSITGGGMWASLSAERQTPFVQASADPKYGTLMIGYEVLKDFWVEGGFRHMGLTVTAQLGGSPQVSTNPSLWDPLLGITYRHRLGRKWMFQGQMDGGGFGVGSDSTIGGSARLDWHFVKHFGTALGFGFQHFGITKPVLQGTQFAQTLQYSNTLYGPIFGLGIYF